MLTVGEILKKRRTERNLTLEDVERRTKIRKKFLDAIEKGDYSEFSSSTYLRGFIKNYSDFLNLPTNEILAIFRREFDKKENNGIVPKTINQGSSFMRLTPTKLSIIVIGGFLVLFFGYLIQGYFQVSGAPYLEVVKPNAGQRVEGSSILVEGKTDPLSKLTINNQEIIIDSEGKFSENVSVGKNTTSIIVISESQNGKRTVVERVIEVINNSE